MKNKIFGILMILVSAMALHSCLLDDDEVFSESASARLAAFNQEVRETLTSGNATWLFEIYPEVNQQYGGYAFSLVFDQSKVAVRSELFGADKEVVSLWKMTTDDGPVLSFDTYNEILHLFSTPSSSMYQAYQGEFEWVVESAEQDLVRLRGKKTGNILYMRRLTESAEDYLNKISEVEESIIMTALSGKINSKDVSFLIDTDNRQFDIFTQTDTISVAYTITPEGFRFYKSVDINGVAVSEMSVNTDQAGAIESVAVKATGDLLSAVFPEGWRPYDAFPGDYTLYYYTYGLNDKNRYEVNTVAQVDVQIVQDVIGKSYLLKGLSPNADIVLSYVKSKGVLGINSQVLGKNGDNNVWLCAWGIDDGGNLSWSTDYGMVSVWNGDEENPKYGFEDNGNWTTSVDSFILWETTATGTSIGVFGDTSWNFVGGVQGSSYGNRLPYFSECALVKK